MRDLPAVLTEQLSQGYDCRVSYTIRSLTLRNATFIVEASGRPPLLFKTGSDPARQVALQRETAISRAILNATGEAFVPEPVDPASRSGMTAFRAISPSSTFRDWYLRQADDPSAVAGELGRHLALVHGLKLAAIGECAGPVGLPWIFSIGRLSASALASLSQGSLALLGIVQSNEELARLLSELAETWTATALTHNDLTWDNVLVRPAVSPSNAARLVITDWETAGAGDPAWDVGTVFSEFLACWLTSIPVVSGEPVEEFAGYPMEEMQPLINAFWSAYCDAGGCEPAAAGAQLVKAVRFAGGRLIQTAYDRTQTVARLTPHHYLLLQLSLNVMSEPGEAAERLLGIRAGGRPAA